MTKDKTLKCFAYACKATVLFWCYVGRVHQSDLKPKMHAFLSANDINSAKVRYRIFKNN